MASQPRVYVETSVIGFLTSRPSSQLHVASKQRYTYEWWQDWRGSYEVYVSSVVLEEIGRGDASAAAERAEVVKGIPVLRFTSEAVELGKAIKAELGLPDHVEDDAYHMALASVHGMRYLLTWNLKHIANRENTLRLGRFLLDRDLEPPIMVTPQDLIDERE